MANVLCALVYLYCSSGCRAGTVASALTFHPPNPAYYDFEESEKSSQVGDKAGEKYTKYKLLLAPRLARRAPGGDSMLQLPFGHYGYGHFRSSGAVHSRGRPFHYRGQSRKC